MKTQAFFRDIQIVFCFLFACLFIHPSHTIASADFSASDATYETDGCYDSFRNKIVFSGLESDFVDFHDSPPVFVAFMVINSFDTVVFDFSMAICTAGVVQVPVFILSDDPVYALDFEMKFNPSEFSYNSLISHKSYLNNSANFHIVDSTLRFSAYSMTPMDNNSPLISLRFNVPSGSLGLSSFYSLRAWLNGDDCSYKSINLPPAPPIVTAGGITSFNAGDSLLLGITVPPGSTNLWSNGATSPSTWVYNPGIYSVAVTNALGCSASSFISVTLNNPLPVELLSFTGEVLDSGIFIKWTTATEVNCDYFELMHSNDGKDWKFISMIEGSGTTSNISYYRYFFENSYEGLNYCRLRQFDFDGTVWNSETILLTDLRNHEPGSDFKIYPNPYHSGDGSLNISIPVLETSGTLMIMEPGGRVMFQKQYQVNCNAGSICMVHLKLNPMFQNGIYLLKWTGNNYTGTTRLVVN